MSSKNNKHSFGKANQKDEGKTIKISPITRISGLMEIEIQIDNHTIINAKSSGLLFRGFEKMLYGRNPYDAIYFTERICGICSAAHGIVSCQALENCLKVIPNSNGVILRNIIHAFEILQNHLRHFYLFTIPDFAVTPDITPVYSEGNYDLRFPEKINRRISQNYIKAIEISRLAHSGVALLGGKAPHNHGVFVGGVTGSVDASKLNEMKFITQKIKSFAENEMMEDVNSVSEYYSDYFKMGKGYGNLLNYGMFNNIKDCIEDYVRPGVAMKGKIHPLDINEITENIFSSYYEGKATQDDLYTSETVPDLTKNNAYSFVKAPRYEDNAMEVGPLARMIISKNYPYRVSMMDRTVARVLEAKKLCGITLELLDCLDFNSAIDNLPEIIEDARGYSMMDTSRGALAHFISIKSKKIEQYNIVTPSAWNCSPKDSSGVYGVIEKALIGTEIQNEKEPVEVARIVRSFDPCISCATHVFCDNYEPLEIII